MDSNHGPQPYQIEFSNLAFALVGVKKQRKTVNYRYSPHENNTVILHFIVSLSIHQADIVEK